MAAAGGEPGGAAGSYGGRSATTIKECRYTASEGCKIDVCKLSLHHVELIPTEGSGTGTDGGQAGRAAGDLCEGRYPSLDSYGWDDKGVWFAEIFFRV